MEKLTKTEYERIKKRSPKRVRKSKRTFYLIENSTYNAHRI